jgi:hypothetical protein
MGKGCKGYLILLLGLALILSVGCPPTPSDTTPPPPITGLTASDAYNGRVVLSWEQSTAEDFDHYNIYQSTAEIVDVAAIEPTHQLRDITFNNLEITGLEDGTEYYFAVTAVDDSDNESSPTMVSATPEAEEPPPADTTPPETTIVSAPAETVTEGDVSFQWTGSDDSTATADLVYSYMLEGYDADYSPFTTDTSKSYTDLDDGQYVFYVRAQDGAGNIDPTPATSSFTVAALTAGGLKILANSELNRIGVGADGESIYALDSANTRLYKSSNGGRGWLDISAGVVGGATWDELVVAPDTAEVVALVTSCRREVSLSTNGGTTFFAMGLAGNLAPGELVRCVAISPAYSGSTREIAVGTSTGGGGGRVWVNIIPSAGWMDVSTGAAGWLPGAPAILGTDVFAVEYSPGFIGDRTILAVVSSGFAPDTDDTYLYLGLRGTGAVTTWNNSVLPGYPVEICQSGGDTPGSPLTYADLALPSNYVGSDVSLRHVYASWSDNPAGAAMAGNPNDDAYRLDDISCTRLYVGGAEFAVSSLAYHGTHYAGKLLAGAVRGDPAQFSVQVYFTAGPQSGMPTWNASLKPPTGLHEAQVAWSPDGTTAYCGTSTIGGAAADQSAFSVSTDNGVSWNQIGLIDT